jgi:D-alanyl-lipoteichoic acid acyltransferase DltB (MBOAT superfamily)
MFESGVFWMGLITVAAGARALPAERATERAGLYLATSIVVLVFGLGLPWWVITALVAVAFWIPVGVRLTRALHRERAYTASVLVFLPLLVPWVLGKEAVASELGVLELLWFAGSSFVLVKAWTLIKDAVDGRFDRPSPWRVAAYLLHFPTYTSGPMHLYREYDAALTAPYALDAERLLDIVYRTLLGLVKLKLLAPLLTPISLLALQEPDQVGATSLAVGAVAYSFVIWFDFSGYSDVAIALSRLAGVDTPENFKNPYGARNIRDFWQRWHITFSRALTSYLFVPLSRQLQPRLKHPKAVMVAAYTGTFAFCGYWHGPTIEFVLWGLWHGLGLIAFDLYRQRAMKRRLALKRKPPEGLAALVQRVWATALTFTFVSVGWIFFAVPIRVLGG